LTFLIVQYSEKKQQSWQVQELSVGVPKVRPTQRAPDGWESPRFQAGFWLEAGSSKTALSHPAHPRVTLTVGRWAWTINPERNESSMKNSIQLVFVVFSISIIVLMMNGCAPASAESIRPNPSSEPIITLEANEPLPTDMPHTIAEAEKLSGFDVKEPAYLPKGVSFDFATYQKPPYPNVTLHFKIVHEQYGDLGAFFQIVQQLQAEAFPDPTACGVNGKDCEISQIGDVTVKYRLTTPTESLMWDVDGFSFHLLRMAGEPNKIYKDELLKVVGSMK
jgi:hypothetical protein